MMIILSSAEKPRCEIHGAFFTSVEHNMNNFVVSLCTGVQASVINQHFSTILYLSLLKGFHLSY